MPSCGTYPHASVLSMIVDMLSTVLSACCHAQAIRSPHVHKVSKHCVCESISSGGWSTYTDSQSHEVVTEYVC